MNIILRNSVGALDFAHRPRLPALRRVLQGRGQRQQSPWEYFSLILFVFVQWEWSILRLIIAFCLILHARPHKGVDHTFCMSMFYFTSYGTIACMCQIKRKKLAEENILHCKFAPLYKKGTEQNQNSPMETTKTPNKVENIPKSPPKNI